MLPAPAHSPGPFSATATGRAVLDGHGRRLAMLIEYGTELGQSPIPIAANAALFVAAPQMLALLLDLVGEIERGDGVVIDHDSWTHARLRALIDLACPAPATDKKASA